MHLSFLIQNLSRELFNFFQGIEATVLSHKKEYMMGKEKSSKLGKRKVKSLTHVQVFVTPWTVTYQAPQSMGFSRHKYGSGLPFPSPRDFPYPGIEPGSSSLQADALPSEPPGSIKR